MPDDRDASTLDAHLTPHDGQMPEVDGFRPPIDSGPATPPTGAVSGVIRVDNIGWRPTDRKIAVLLGNAGATVELHAYGDNSVVGTYTAGSTQNDEDSGDAYATVDFSDFTTVGDYYLYLPAMNLRSYTFRISDDVFTVVGAAAMKSYFFQRCNQDRALPYAGDALAGYPGIGGQWVDSACHAMDTGAGPGPDSASNGALDVHGGWHDAGDYQKTLWGRGVPQVLFAYEINPGAWGDDQLNIPESGNGIPDILDEVRWELDFYVRMQRPDGHFMTSTKGCAPDSGAISSPPSMSNENRVYFDTTAPSGGCWSGGGVTIAAATGNATLALAHASIVFAAAGQAAIADGYATAARSGWSWLNGQTLGGGENQLKAAAAAAVHRMDGSIASAQTFGSGFAWSTFDGGGSTPGEGTMTIGAYHILLDSASSGAMQAAVRTALVQIVIDPAFEETGAYGGMRGGGGNGWDYSWGSNRQQSAYGANLMMLHHLGILGSRTDAEVVARAEQHLHYILGLNPLNMVYLTNMAAYGGEHSSFQLFHSWFSITGADGDHGNPSYNGKPTSVDDPLYPYYPDDGQTSMYGPAPGLLVGGPNYYYDCAYTIPNRANPAYAYRDFSVGCQWNGSACEACSWEITEPDVGYQGPFIMLASFFMSGATP